MDEHIPEGYLDDEELIARGIIAVEPTRRGELARGFARMSWGIFLVFLLITAPIGFVLMSVAAERLRRLHPDMRTVRRLALALTGLSSLGIVSFAVLGVWRLPGNLAWTVFAASFFLAGRLLWFALTVVLFWKLCSVVADLAEQARESETKKNAFFRRRLYVCYVVYALVVNLVGVTLSELYAAEGHLGGFRWTITLSLTSIAEIVLWLVVLCLFWGLMRQAEGIVQYSEAFDYLDEAESDMVPNPA